MRPLIVTIASFKGGVGKTTSAVHLAAVLQQSGPTLLLDGDPNRQALCWARHARLPFRVVDISQAARYAGDFAHIVIDTAQRPTSDDFAALAAGCDLLVVPTVPGTLDTFALTATLGALQTMPGVRYRVLLVKVVPPPEPEAAQLRAELAAAGVPMFAAEIPRLKAFERAVSAGVPVYGVTGDRRAARAWTAYEAVGKELLT